MARIFPVAGNPAEVYQAVENYNSWLLENEIPKLFFWADPGKIIPLELSKYYSENLKNVKSVPRKALLTGGPPSFDRVRDQGMARDGWNFG